MSRTKSPGKTWVAGEIKLGRKAARPAVMFGAAQVIAGILSAFCAAHLLGAVFLPHSPAALYAAGFALAAIARAACLHRAETLGFEAGAAARHRLRGKILSALLAAGPIRLHGQHSAALAGIAVDRVEAMNGLHANWIAATSLASLGPALVGLAALAGDWRSGVILIIAGLLVPVGMAVAGIGAGLAASRQFTAMTRLQTRFLDRIRGISTIVLAGRAKDEAAALARAADELRRRTMRVLRVAFLSSTILDLAAAAALVLIVIRFAAALHGDAGLVPTALFLLLLTPEFFAPLRAFAAVYQDRMAAEAVADDFASLPEPPQLAQAAAIRTITAEGVTLTFDDVSFAWGGTPVLKNLSFRVPAGEILLITGASGAGKSTILDLVLGFIEPESGKISLNGQDAASLTAAARTGLIGWIGQKPMIFAGSILDNLKFAKPDATEAEIADAIRRARLTETIAALPLGLHTQIGDSGFGLSGGQAQRIAIARAFLKDAKLLLLDEPTAHLDPAIEKDVLDNLKRLAIGRTVILASHSALAQDFARDTGARKLDLDALRHAKRRGVA